MGWDGMGWDGMGWDGVSFLSWKKNSSNYSHWGIREITSILLSIIYVNYKIKMEN